MTDSQMDLDAIEARAVDAVTSEGDGFRYGGRERFLRYVTKEEDAYFDAMDPATTLALVARLREAETQLANVRDLAARWRQESRVRGPEDKVFSSGVANMLFAAVGEEPAPVEPEVPARRRGRPGETEPDTRGYMGGV